VSAFGRVHSGSSAKHPQARIDQVVDTACGNGPLHMRVQQTTSMHTNIVFWQYPLCFIVAMERPALRNGTVGCPASRSGGGGGIVIMVRLVFDSVSEGLARRLLTTNKNRWVSAKAVHNKRSSWSTKMIRMDLKDGRTEAGLSVEVANAGFHCTGSSRGAVQELFGEGEQRRFLQRVVP
jgi:hypothetical protein